MTVPDLTTSPSLTVEENSYIWVISDIQPTSVPRAESTLQDAVDDILSLNLSLDAIWILGDAHRGAEEGLIEAVARLFVEQLNRLNVPVCYILGNHEMDLGTAPGFNRFPLLELGLKDPGWIMPDRLEDFYFTRKFGETLVVFMGDHAHESRAWWTTHGHAREDGTIPYPHDESAYQNLSQAISAYPGPVIIASHYAFPGGQKPSKLLAQMQPLPDNVKLILHGHAHIGDLVWNKDDPWERVHVVEGQPHLTQINISALEAERSPGSHSALLRLGPVGPTSLRMRCHQERRWLESLEF